MLAVRTAELEPLEIVWTLRSFIVLLHEKKAKVRK